MSEYEDPHYDEIDVLIDTDVIALGRRCREAEAKVARLEAILDAVNDDIGSDYLDLIAEELES